MRRLPCQCPTVVQVVVFSVVGASLLAAASCAREQEADHERAIDVAATAPASEHRPCPVLTIEGACDALLRKDVVKLASGGLVLPAAWFAMQDPSHATLAVGVRWGAQRLVIVKSAAPSSYDGSVELSVEGATGATGVTTGRDRLLYYVARNGGVTGLHVAMVEDGGIGEPHPVELGAEGAFGAPLWPQAVALVDGRVLLAFVAPDGRILAGAAPPSARSFQPTEVRVPDRDPIGRLVHVGVTTAGAWVLSYQRANSWRHFHSSVVVSSDEGRSWSPPIALPTTADESLSDVFPIARTDRGADLYYARGAPGFENIRRRSLHEDGGLGLEQIVTSEELGRTEKPQPRRRLDGRLTMLLTLRRGAPGTLALAVLDGDAPW